jgi:hypothetical protein
LKRDVTKYGKRTTRGAINDGVNSARRYFINNYHDEKNQLGLDLILGNSIQIDNKSLKNNKNDVKKVFFYDLFFNKKKNKITNKTFIQNVVIENNNVNGGNDNNIKKKKIKNIYNEVFSNLKSKMVNFFKFQKKENIFHSKNSIENIVQFNNNNNNRSNTKLNIANNLDIIQHKKTIIEDEEEKENIYENNNVEKFIKKNLEKTDKLKLLYLNLNKKNSNSDTDESKLIESYNNNNYNNNYSNNYDDDNNNNNNNNVYNEVNSNLKIL